MTLSNVSNRSRFAIKRNLVSGVIAAFFALTTLVGGVNTAIAQPLTAEAEMFKGKADAKVTVIEYASMTCPHCARFHTDQWPAIKKAYVDTGKVKFVFQEFPLDRGAFWAAILARCSGKDRYFAFIDLMFKRQGAWANRDPMPTLTKLGALGGVSEDQFKACLADKALGDGLLKSRQTGGKDFGVDSTPSFVVNGKLEKGIYNLETFAAVVDPLLN